MNNVVLVGRLVADPVLNEIDNDKKVSSLILAVNRNFKNPEGIYETDFIKCILWNNIAINTCDFCKSGDVVGIKGRLQSSRYEDENKKTHYITDVVAEKVTFLSSKKNDVNNN